MKNNIALLFGFLLTTSAIGAVEAHKSVRSILARTQAPPGVVFEIVSGQERALERMIPEVNRQIDQLRTRFPNLDIVVVSHGSEQFALTSANREQYRSVHSGVEQLKRDKGVNVHVCATHASWRNVEREDFPDYVKVSDVGPATINKYRELGYELVRIH